MKPSSLASAINLAVEKKRPVMLWGPPGIGKSDVVRQVAKKRNAELRDVRLSLLDPVDLKGFPVPDHTARVMDWLPPSFLPPMKVKNKANMSHGILFLDELVSAAPAVQAAAYQLILDRKIGDYELPANWAIVAAGNRAGDRAVVHTMPSALANRFVHLDVEVNLDDWCEWALDHDVDIDVIAFLRFRPALLHKFDPKDNPRAFPSPRSWTFVNDLLKSQLQPDVEFEMIKGAVGEGPAGEFMAFIKIVKELPSVDEIMLNPEKTKVPEQPASLFALATALAAKATKGNFDRIAKYVDRMKTEFQVLFYRDAVKREDAVSETKAFIDWSVKHSGILS